MKQYRGAVFFDVDGTLVDERQEIFTPTPKVREAIFSLKERGYFIAIATGRARCYTPDFDIPFDGFVSCNGADVEIDGKLIFEDCFDPARLDTLLSYMEQNDIGYMLENSKKCYIQKKAQAAFDAMLADFNIQADCFYPLETIEGIEVTKLLFTFDRMEQFMNLRDNFAEEYAVIQHHQRYSGDLGKRSVSKASGILAAVRYLGLPIENTYAFGDDGNDFEMLAAVGHGVAMTPHAAALDRAADLVTCGVREDGVYHGLKALGLLDGDVSLP